MIIGKALLRGLATMTVVCTMVATAIGATSHLMSASFEARTDTRSLVGYTSPTVGMSWFAWRDDGMVTRSLASLDPAASELPAGSHGQMPGTVTLAGLPSSGTLNNSDDDALYTGSIGGNFAARFDAAVAAPRFRFENPVLKEDEPRQQALPMPRSRPRLASLPSADDLKFLPDDDDIPAKTAIYDINAKTVYMPNGERLQAHSGFGQYMDDPKHVRLRMRGVTPPNTYKLTMREALFHGVEAIRMNPEDKAAMFGRAGILVHPFMLGPNGQSNGCVSVKDYPKFLAAFKRGEVNRMIVVFRLDKAPSMLARRNTRSANAI